MCRLLIVDDEPEIRRVVRKLGESLDFEIAEAASYKEAVVKLQEFVPHVLLVDVNLPDGRGTNLLNEVMKFPAVSLIFTGEDLSEEDAVAAIEHEALAVITKPESINKLLAYLSLAKKIADGRGVVHQLSSLRADAEAIRDQADTLMSVALSLSKGREGV